MGDCLLGAVVLKTTEIAHIFGILFPLLRLCIDFEKNAFGYISEFGHKPIWSHW
jgi:hypothetical protein